MKRYDKFNENYDRIYRLAVARGGYALTGEVVFVKVNNKGSHCTPKVGKKGLHHTADACFLPDDKPRWRPTTIT